MPASFRRAAVLTVATALLAVAAPARATDTVDRDYTGTSDEGTACAQSRNSVGWALPMAISFDPLSTGALSRVTLSLQPFLAGSPDVTVQVVEAWSAESPKDRVIAEATVPAATVLAGPTGPTGVGHLVDFAFAQRPVLRRGDRYFAILRVADDPAGTSSYCVSKTLSTQGQIHITGFENGGAIDWNTPPADADRVLVLADYLTAAPTKLTVSPWLNPLGSPVVRYHAELIAGGITVAGEQVTFSAGGRTLCTATTGSNGIAECDGLAGQPAPDGYDATFGGSPLLLPSTGHGGLVV